MEEKFSFYRGGIKNTIPSYSITLNDLNMLIKSTSYFEIISKYRQSGSDNLKMGLDYITPAGVFSKRNNESIVAYSGLVSLDFDDIENVVKLKESLISGSFNPCFMYVSPGGKGLKVFYRVDLAEDDYSEYIQSLFSFTKALTGYDADKQCKDISRASFLSYDPNVYFNPDAKALNKDFIFRVKKDSVEKGAIDNISDLDSSIERMIAHVSKTQTFMPGNRNNFILHLSGALNRVGISKEEAIESLVEKYESSDFTAKEIEDTINSAYKNTNYHGVAPLSEKRTPEKAFSHLKDKRYDFPTSGLPKIVIELVKEISETYQIPVEFPIISCLSAFSAVIKKKVFASTKKFKNYPQIWGMIVAQSGVGKTEQLELIFRPLKDIDRENYDDYRLQMAAWKYDCIRAKKDKEPEPDKPILKQLLVDDFTPESLYKALQQNMGAISLCRDELSGWFNDFGRYNKNGEVARYLSIFNNNQFSITRKSEEPLLISEPYMTICGTIQPEVLFKLLDENDYKESGFAARFMFVFHDNLHRMYYNEKEVSNDIYEKYKQLILKANEYTFDNYYTLCPDANKKYIKYENELTDLINSTDNSFLKSGYSKMPVHLLRLSLIVQVIQDLENDNISYSISEIALEFAIQCCRYFIDSFTCIATRGKLNSNVDKKIVAKYLMTNYDYSQNKVADILQVSQQYINKIK